ncbi:alkylglycerol monooxygenase [Orussus abietinus]|uniref:alkylglycerol monooxygenase n=1 Tax=Orussus abietinus TaxID=222816 RepID=UPI0006257A72|nr:alkylglycerol monooxygenase [Orussus abietinus]XP_012276751.1 alkylglycerol monooxygenase [Orussus abietinus]
MTYRTQIMNVTHDENIDYIGQVKNFGQLWYLVNPYDSTFESPDAVPDYQQQVWLSFFVLIVLEHLILLRRKKTSFRLNDQVTSLSHWILQESWRILFRGVEYYAYIWIYERYRVCGLPWDSLWTWYVTVIGVDFCYYWVHRANHEIHVLWAQHQVHHSSEEFNLAVGLRQSVLQHWCSFVFYLPLALVIPPSHFITHHQLNLVYQLWIHTTVVKNLGPLEFILNTPKHHRVHHGCNLYCLDKNYGGVFIIWDRIFGTFMEERPKEDIIYGLVMNPRSFNPLYLQIFYTREMLKKCSTMTFWGDKLSVIWKGPSWFPSSPRLGLDEFKLNITSRIKYDPHVPMWLTVYISLQFCLILCSHVQLYGNVLDLKDTDFRLIMLNNLFALTTIGLLFDRSRYASLAELIRCIFFLMTVNNMYNKTLYKVVFYVHITSTCLWVCYIARKTRLDRGLKTQRIKDA